MHGFQVFSTKRNVLYSVFHKCFEFSLYDYIYLCVYILIHIRYR